MQILGFLSAALIGISLGLIGGGGSILTVPILVYLLEVTPVSATAYSLFIVGFTALIGSLTYIKRGLINYKAAVYFAIPSFITVYLTRRFLMPAIPDIIFQTETWTLSKNVFVMLLFSLLMIAAAFSMIRKSKIKNAEEESEPVYNFPFIALEGIVVGILTGFVGAGGGFLIIPALVVFAKVPMKTAVGTSLLIIAAKSLIGFLGDLDTQAIDWFFLLKFSIFTTLGIFLGGYISRFVSGAKLKPAFGWFALSMGFIILINEFFY